MPTKRTVNCATGQVEEIEMVGAELAAFEATRAATPPAREETPAMKLARLRSPRVITGSRTTDRDAILASLLQACADAGFVIDQTRA